MIPRINCGLFPKKVYRDNFEDEDIIVQKEGQELETNCLLFKVGLAEIEYFTYTHSNDHISVNISTSKLIEHDYLDYSIPILNSLLTPANYIDSEHFDVEEE